MELERVNKKRVILECISFYLASYEEWPDDESANSLEYFVFKLKSTGISNEKIYPVLVKHFKEFS